MIIYLMHFNQYLNLLQNTELILCSVEEMSKNVGLKVQIIVI